MKYPMQVLILAILVCGSTAFQVCKWSLTAHQTSRSGNRLTGVTKLKMTDGNVRKPVLVVGAAGRLGRRVVEGLLKRDMPVRAMVRDPDCQNAKNLNDLAKNLPGKLEIVQGDVTKFPTVLSAMQGCDACISCHGTVRFTNFIKDTMFKVWDPTNEFLGAWGPSRPDPAPLEWGGDFSFLDPAADPSHPWNTNFYGVCNLADSAEAAGCRHLVRVTGLSVGLGPFHPFTFLANLLLSMSVKWHCEGERRLRWGAAKESVGGGGQRLSYTIVRPSGLVDAPVGVPDGQHLALAAGGQTVSIGRIGLYDVADLCIEALTSPHAANATLSCSWAPGPGPTTWATALPAAAAAAAAAGPAGNIDAAAAAAGIGDPPPFSAAVAVAAAAAALAAAADAGALSMDAVPKVGPWLPPLTLLLAYIYMGWAQLYGPEPVDSEPPAPPAATAPPPAEEGEQVVGGERGMAGK